MHSHFTFSIKAGSYKSIIASSQQRASLPLLWLLQGTQAQWVTMEADVTGKEQPNLPFVDPLAKLSDHTVVITAIRCDKAAAKPKVICTLTPDVSGAESVNTIRKKRLQECYPTLLYKDYVDCDKLSSQHPLILVFRSDMKFSFKISFLEQILF